MFHRLSTDTLNWIIIIGIALFILELAFFHGGMVIPALFSALAIYIGRKHLYEVWGKVVFWLGVIGFVFSVLNMLAVRFLIVAGIVLFVMDYMKTKKEAQQLHPDRTIISEQQEEELIQIKPLFNHRLFGEQSTESEAYKWHDMNIHGGFGDRIIDLSNTVLPEDTAVISIRHFIGNLEIYVPYEVEVSIHHSAVFGRAHIFGQHHWKLMNQSVLYQTEAYASTYPRVKIVTSLFSGDIEVRRI
ncbi:cell wall-active antibiotics response protein LiaF [Virgibacillus sp. MG-45]|uniref:cell wall-active antibiotics response protein LiaF n=1 Tax=Virgibacillus sp. MG-45 TaxID=3102791 RepID=UPI002EDB0C8C